jgi:ATP-dependent Lon protease
LLVNPVWGAGTLSYVPEEDHEDRMRVRLDRFESIQLSSFDLDLYAERRRHFTLDEWMRILISSQGLNPDAYASEEQWLLLISRMAPMAQANLNLFELAPKGTGKTYIYKNLSTYSYVISGGAVTPAQLFYNLSTRPSPGLLAMNDVVIFDEIQTIHFGDSKEVGGILKDYMESGSFQRAKKPVRAYASCVFLGNIQMTEGGDPANQRWFDELPFPLCESALIHRIHAFIPGWRLPKINIAEVALAKGDGFAADYLGEALHALRSAHHLDKIIQTRVRVIDTEDIRDERAIKRMTTALFKVLFPHGEATRDELMETCVRPAVEFRRHVRRQLQLIDPEFRHYSLGAEVD